MTYPEVVFSGFWLWAAPKCHLKPGVRLEEPVETVAVRKADEGGRAEVIGGISNCHRGPCSKTDVVVVDFLVFGLTQGHGAEKTAETSKNR